MSMTNRVHVLACSAALLLVAGCGSRTPPPTSRDDWKTAPAGASRSLEARVTFDAMRLGIENLAGDTWTDIVIEVRRATDARVYRYRTDVIVAGRTLLVGALNFEGDDGRRMSPFDGAPAEWRIQATLPDGTGAWASGPIIEVAPD
jgi:hypothetical protein